MSPASFGAPFLVLILGIALLAIPAATQSHAQTDFPNKPIRLIVPFAPGGLADITMRIVGEKLGERLGQRVVIDNRPSGGGISLRHRRPRRPRPMATR